MDYLTPFAQFHFLRPAWLLALLPLGLLLWWGWRRRSGGGNWEAVCEAHLLPHLLIGGPGGGRRKSLAALAAGGLLAIVALAGPAWEKLPRPVLRDQSALVIALDLSRSMDAADLKPSRLERARYKVADILRQRREGQTGLVVYAGEAFVLSPLTPDTETIAAHLSSLETALMPAQGSRADLALERAGELLRQAGVARGGVLLVTDGIRGDRVFDAAADFAAEGHRLAVLGVGTPEGAPIPAQGGFLKDAAGSIVLPRLEADTLRKLTVAGGGVYRTITPDDGDLEALLPLFAPGRLGGNVEETVLKADAWREAGPWLLLPLLPLAALAFRRGVLTILPLALMPLTLLPLPAQAIDLSGLWLRQDQQAARALEKGEASAAAEGFTDPAWKGAAHYRAGEYQEAEQALQGLAAADALYNRGNALARLGRYPQALEAYEKALEKDPDHADAAHNRDLVRKELENQQQPSSSDEQGEG
ncbi:MAG: hypothetical protein C0617_16420 [Desulfuromonas sp.]|nr:VWA domain-containing protein [Desulfuromonas sp.]PLX81675.1 MAG: hypothetical protein C0617_16420 [Desulfuromonas sp.]